MSASKKRTYGILVVIFTIITVLGIFNMRPTGEGLLPGGYESLDDKSSLRTKLDIYFDNILDTDTEKGEYEIPYEMIIDEDTLDRFIRVYHDKIKENESPVHLTAEEKEEVRWVLENMGTINTTQLKEILQEKNSDQMVQKVWALLEENLFERELKYLEELILKK